MDRHVLIRFFLWNSILSFGLLLLWTLLFATSADFVYAVHSKLFAIPRVHFDTVIYTLIGLFKLLALLLFVFPLISLLILGKNTAGEMGSSRQ